ncbi:MAG: GGDEF domain-containing protein [Nitrospinota bacterium]
MALFKRTKPSEETAPSNGREPTVEALEAENGGGPAPWSRLATSYNQLFLDLARAIDSPKLGRLEQALSHLPKTAGAGPYPGNEEKDVGLLTKKGAEYILDARKYLRDKEGELKEVIRLLSKTIAEMSREDDVFVRSMLESTDRLTTISELEDIRAIRESLSAEISVIKETVRQREEGRTVRMSQLAKRVDVLQEELEVVAEESVRDQLTGLYNRRAFDQELKGLLERNRILPNPFLLVIFDLDDFKRINDRLGHPVGDKALQAVAKTARENLRTSDFLARYGGDEFVIILHTDSLKKGRKKIDALVSALSKVTIPIVLDGKSRQLALTLSFGIARYREDDTEDTLFSRADEALYLSKNAGKNRVSSEEDLP